MSALASYKSPARPSLSLVQGLRSVTDRQANPRLAFAAMVTAGLLGIAILNLLLNLATSSGVYELAGLKNQQKSLQLSSQILQQQVDSLSSNQNLASAAQAMGMVANANPVFLDVNNSKVYGEPAAAIASATDRVSGNLIANSQWTTKSHAGQIQAALSAEQAKATQNVASSFATDSTASASSTKPATATSSWTNAAQGYVGGAKSSTSQVGLAGGGIPAAATH
jgi:outer membrane murein-binding lipoprotein Lpp